MASAASSNPVAAQVVPGMFARQLLYVLLGFSAGLPFYMFSTVLSLRLQAHEVVGRGPVGHGSTQPSAADARAPAVARPGPTRLTSMSETGPLSDVVVADLSRALAGPHATMMLGDLGARVIKVETPGRGDDTRGLRLDDEVGAGGAARADVGAGFERRVERRACCGRARLGERDGFGVGTAAGLRRAPPDDRAVADDDAADIGVGGGRAARVVAELRALGYVRLVCERLFATEHGEDEFIVVMRAGEDALGCVESWRRAGDMVAAAEDGTALQRAVEAVTCGMAQLEQRMIAMERRTAPLTWLARQAWTRVRK